MNKPSKVALTALLAGPGVANAQTASQAPTVVPAVAPSETEAVLAAAAVDENAPARNELFSWTTQEQLAQLRHAPDQLLIRDGSPEFGPGPFRQTIARLSNNSTDSLAVLLRHEGFVRARFAWSNPWATVAGSHGRR